MKKKIVIDKELIEKVASLARLRLSDDEKSLLVKDFRDILDAFSKIEECNTSNIGLSIHPVPLRNFMRDDVIKKCLSQADALKNSESVREGYFKGPRAV